MVNLLVLKPLLMNPPDVITGSLLLTETSFRANHDAKQLANRDSYTDVISGQGLLRSIESNIVWLIDNGHGPSVDGKPTTRGTGNRSPELEDGRRVFEGDYVRAISSKMIEMAKDKDIPCHIINPDMVDLDLRIRTERINRYVRRNPNCILISLHANIFGDGETFNAVGGIETFYPSTHPKKEISRQLAEIFQKHLVKKSNLSNRGIKEGNFHMLRESTCPAILTENGFMTNKVEAEKMLSPDFQEKLAEAYVQGMLEVSKLRIST